MLSKKINILLTNDDGVHAPGIRHLWKTLKDHANVYVVAPATEQSGVGLSTTRREPLHLDKVFWDDGIEAIWSVTGTPSDCVKLALNVILDAKPDMIISGINRGGNLGRGLLYSGTVAASIESTMQEIPSIAFSCCDYDTTPEYKTAADYTLPIIDFVLNNPMPKGTFLNVNFPEKVHGTIKGIKMTKQGGDWWAESPEKRVHPSEGKTYYWLGSQLRTVKEEEDSESSWLNKGYIAAVPIHVGNLTDMNHLNKHAEAFQTIFDDESVKCDS